MYTLIIGGTGFLGSALIPRLLTKGKRIILLSHKKSVPLPKGVVLTEGDITQPNLGISNDFNFEVSDVVHMAANHNLGRDRDGAIWKTNVEGTQNVVSFCSKYHIPHLYFCSTAYADGKRNTYENSKAEGESLVKASTIPQVTIFKPSIIMGSPQHFFPGHFCQLVSILIQMHHRAETVRRKIEGTLRLPVLEPVFHFLANAEGKLNLVPVEPVAEAMATIDKPGTYWLTHPSPPTIGQLVEWVGEFILVRLEISHTFKSTPLEAMFYRLAYPFLPYLQGEDFPSDLTDCPPITKDFIQQNLKQTILG